MGILGASNNAPGVGTGLTYIGDHCYAHSGFIASTTTESTQLKFDIANQFVMATIMLNGGIDPVNITNGIDTIFYIIMNGEKVAAIKTETNLEDMPSTILYQILIPPYTALEITADSTFTGYQTSVTLEGRVYG